MIPRRSEAPTAHEVPGDSTLAPLSNTKPPLNLLDNPTFDARYEIEDVIGKGGMGVVRRCLDRRIGRDVAMKKLRTDDDATAQTERFLREVCVQGQLEHPAIVPVYDLARDPEGALFFTMKRLRGVTLREILIRLRSGDTETMQQYSRRKLLAAFGTVCNAVQFAHARGVVHRDLKPSNVMFGDFGEVYVLDWGVAKVLGWDEPLRNSLSRVTDGSQTSAGVQIGTPGFMAPEQVRGEIVDARADVYSLGAILFEILTLQPLHKRDDPLESHRSTLEGAEARPSLRVPHANVPPELEAICVNATAVDPAERFPNVRALNEAVERFLDGDRDVERRRELGSTHAAAAAEHAERALVEGSLDNRQHALREVGLALALDPSNAAAVDTFLRLMTVPPREMPDGVRDELYRLDSASRREGLRGGAARQLAPLAFLPFLFWMDASALGIASLAMWSGLAGIVFFRSGQAVARPDRFDPWVILACSLAAGMLSTLFGPYVLVPSVAVILATQPIARARNASGRSFIIALACAPIIVPAVLGWLGAFPAAYAFHGVSMEIVDRTLHFARVPTEVFLMFWSVAVVIVAGLTAARTRDALTRAQEALAVQAWQLRQLVSHRQDGAGGISSPRTMASAPASAR